MIVNQLCEGIKVCGIGACSLDSGVDTKNTQKNSKEV